jgi:hypothetical protein
VQHIDPKLLPVEKGQAIAVFTVGPAFGSCVIRMRKVIEWDVLELEEVRPC